MNVRTALSALADSRLCSRESLGALTPPAAATELLCGVRTAGFEPRTSRACLMSLVLVLFAVVKGIKLLDLVCPLSDCIEKSSSLEGLRTSARGT